MKCKQVQEWILTDYLDGEMSLQDKNVLESHLKTCATCREFASAVKKISMEPFQDLRKENPPDVVWSRIKESILFPHEEQEPFWKKFLEGRRESWVFKPQPAFAMGLVVVLFIGVILGSTSFYQQAKNKKVQEQVEYLAYLMQGEESQLTENKENFGTYIEEYFL